MMRAVLLLLLLLLLAAPQLVGAQLTYHGNVVFDTACTEEEARARSDGTPASDQCEACHDALIPPIPVGSNAVAHCTGVPTDNPTPSATCTAPAVAPEHGLRCTAGVLQGLSARQVTPVCFGISVASTDRCQIDFAAAVEAGSSSRLASTCVGAAGSATASCIYNATGNACENYGCVYTPSTSCYEQWYAAVGGQRSDCPPGCDYARSSTEECSPLRLSTPRTSAALGALPALVALALTSALHDMNA